MVKTKLPFLEDLPVRTTFLDISKEEKVCQETGQALVLIGVEISHRLAHEHGSYYVKEIIRQKNSKPLVLDSRFFSLFFYEQIKLTDHGEADLKLGLGILDFLTAL